MAIDRMHPETGESDCANMALCCQNGNDFDGIICENLAVRTCAGDSSVVVDSA